MVFDFDYVTFGTITVVVGPINFSRVFWFDGIPFELFIFFFWDCYGIIWAARDHKDGQECKDNVFHKTKVQKKLGSSKFFHHLFNFLTIKVTTAVNKKADRITAPMPI